MSHEDDIRKEREAVDRLNAALEQISEDIIWYWGWGDGEGGYVLEKLPAIVNERDFDWPGDGKAKPRIYQKKVISRSLSKAVFERDAFRCVICSTHVDLTCDHIYPESLGGETILANLQTMCRSCNAKKGVRT
ncbi:HNH endonuclease [Sphingomonas paeninsulae]|uniref:HNH endonuclease n=1 Tax=Sphingomonas paeninsulae TaxID=2319844 RepID=A0A494TQA3_SPHPE|nr:HNH endonuclease [Sphingomonas paeninsulae]AYJ87648.1 HNH endonuclease [Sphingomonas paeninsulae]